MMSFAVKRTDSSDPPSSVDLRKKKVLVVEDFFSFRLTVKNMLRSFKVTDTDEAADGDEAINKMSIKKYDIILCDYNLGPGKDGQQILEEAKHREYISYSTIFMMVTAENTLDMFMGALEYQPDDYLMKPFTKEALERKLCDLTRKKENLKEIEAAVKKKDYTTAIGLCDKLINGHAKNLSELFKLKGEFLIRTEKYAEAESFYEEVLTKGNLPWAKLGLGRIKFITGRYPEAKNIFEELIAKNKKMTASYDWLAKTMEKMGDEQDAQNVLSQAIQISPKAILRQKALGELAYKNKDLQTAEKAFKEAVKQGKHSCFKNPADYTTLATVLAENGDPDQGINVLNDAGKEFPELPTATVQIAVTECFVYNIMNNKQEAEKAALKAAGAASEIEGNIPSAIALDLAKALFLTGEDAKGTMIVRRLVQSNHEDQTMIGTVYNMFQALNMEDRGVEIISVAREEIIKLNNDGVRLVREGQLDEAIDFFRKAALNLPENKTINANAAQALMLCMTKSGRKDDYMEETITYLNRVKNIDPSYKDLPKLYEMYNELAKEA